MGPTLFDLFKFTDGFDRKTIINILILLIEKLRYLSNHGIIHYDVKPENIVWGIFNQSKINNINECYFIDYGLAIDLENDIFENKNYKKWKIGTPRYMSINAQKNLKPNYIADLESFYYIPLYI